MAPRAAGGVVDGALKVYGTTNLRVVDASVLPVELACHIQATVYAIAEKVRMVCGGRVPGADGGDVVGCGYDQGAVCCEDLRSLTGDVRLWSLRERIIEG